MNLIYKIALLLAFAPAIVPAIAAAQDKSWEAKKAERFKELTDEQKTKIEEAIPETANEEPTKERRILVFYRCEGFIHDSIPHGNYAVQAMGEKTGAFTADLADTYDVFSERNLKKYDCILLNNTTHMTFENPEQQSAFMDFIANGKGLAGFHAASDNFGRHPECRAIVGGQFAGHPWGAGGTWAFKLDDPKHVLNKAFNEKGFWHADEIYQYNKETWQGEGVLRVLVSLDMTKDAVSKQIKDGPREVAVSWIREAGDGRVFYTNFGHRQDTFTKPNILSHMLDGIQYAIGDLKADATPTAKASVGAPALAPESPDK